MPINKFTTLLDLARQAKIISGETATFDGKIQVGIPFSGYPTGVDTGTTVSLGIVSSEDAVFSGNTGTTIFDVSNTGSTNYSPIFSGYTASTWTNPLFSGNTSGLTLPITPLSADTQIVGPFWTLTQTGMTGDYVIGTQYTGYSVTYSFFNVSQFGTGFTYSGFTTASQENFSAGTLDYKGPLDYISTKEDASVEGRLTTNKITITNGASASTIGYVLTQTGENGEAEWVINASADTNTYVTGGTLTGTDLTLDWNTGGSANPIDLSGLEFTGNTSGDCITDLYVRRLYGCSPITVHDTITYNGSIIDSATTNSFIFGSNHVLTASSLTHGVNADANVILGGSNNRLLPFQLGDYNTIIGGSNNTLGIGRLQSSSIISSDDSTISSSNGPNVILGGSNNTINGSNGNVILGGSNNNIDSPISSAILGGTNNSILALVNRSVILGGSGITGTTDDTVYTPDLNVSGDILVENTNGEFFTDIQNSAGINVNISAGTNSQLSRITISDVDSGIALGHRGNSEPSFPGYGKQGDGFLYSGNEENGLNIISQPGTGTDDYIRFFAGQASGAAGTPDLYIQGSGSTRGNVGINTETPSEKLVVDGNVKIIGNAGAVTRSLTIGDDDEITFTTLGSSVTDNVNIISQTNNAKINLKNGIINDRYSEFAQYNTYGAIAFNVGDTGNSTTFIVNDSTSGVTIFRVGDEDSLSDVMYMFGKKSEDKLGPFTGVTDSKVVYAKGYLSVQSNISVGNAPSAVGSATLFLDGDGILTVDASDERLKENISPLSGSLETILNINGVSYNAINKKISGEEKFYGFIAQQVDSVDSNLTFTNKSDGYMGIKNNGILPLLVESIKEIYNNPSIPNYTPTSSNDIYGNVGNITTDDDYLYIKTNNGWKRTSLQSF